MSFTGTFAHGLAIAIDYAPGKGNSDRRHDDHKLPLPNR